MPEGYPARERRRAQAVAAMPVKPTLVATNDAAAAAR
jgi:hypothetical protein